MISPEVNVSWFYWRRINLTGRKCRYESTTASTTGGTALLLPQRSRLGYDNGNSRIENRDLRGKGLQVLMSLPHQDQNLNGVGVAYRLLVLTNRVCVKRTSCNCYCPVWSRGTGGGCRDEKTEYDKAREAEWRKPDYRQFKGSGGLGGGKRVCDMEMKHRVNSFFLGIVLSVIVHSEKEAIP